MIVDAVFHIYECKKSSGCKLLDGRLLYDISLRDELIAIENVDINYYNCNKDGRLLIDNYIPYEKIKINKIFSY